MKCHDTALKEIVHLMPDEKFLDYFIKMSEHYLPGRSSYIITGAVKPLKFIKSETESIRLLSDFEDGLSGLCKLLEGSRLIVFHSFTTEMLPFIRRIPAHLKKHWLFWGFDGYAAMPYPRYLGWHSDRARFPPGLSGLLKFFVSRGAGRFLNAHQKEVREIIQSMDYCITWVYDDYLLARSINPRIKYLNFSYYAAEFMGFADIGSVAFNPNRLFLGNSASPTNNHLEALSYLHKIRYPGEIICPLSYADHGCYVAEVLATGARYFGARFRALKDFMPLQEYQSLVDSCGLVWMNHKRQQAAGNLFAGFVAQKVIITDESNPMNTTFKEWGLHFYTKDVLSELQAPEALKLAENRRIILEKVRMGANAPFFEALGNMSI